MISQITSKLEELEAKKSALSPRIEEIEEKRNEELAEVNKKYDHLVEDASIEVENFENKIMNEMIDLFVKVVMEEFDAKRSTSDYVLTDKFKDFREEITKIKIFPQELVERLDKVIEGDPVEKIAYDIEKIESKYKKI
ncbi:MAG: hypothetical protein EU531_06285 [Promethearchaeota archaeon]|nr:MAG: hypothetical protein EU531_06285 [Candidatus Lokiarchaeota archaeon]